jgi:PAS domain S-box-containing protein
VAPLVKNGRLVAALGVHHGDVHAWTTDELSLLDEVAQRTWASVERARAEARLTETQRRLEDALSMARMAYWDWDHAANHTVGSPSMNDVFGLREGETLDFATFRSTLVHPDDRERHQVHVRHARTCGDGWHGEFRIVRPRDGEIAWLEERATITTDPASGTAHTTALVWDVTDRKRAEETAERERLAKDRDTLRRQLAGAEEDERRRLARELHDQLGQELTAFQLGLVDATRLAGTHDGSRAESDAPLFRTLERLRILADRMVAGARYVALELRPPELDDVGLESAIETYVHEWSGRYGISADVAAMGLAEEDPMPTELASALYRIVQEALTNVAKHAGATQVSVIVERPAGEVRLIVEDDGRGFDLDETAVRVRNERRLGLAGIRERVALVGGSVSVESSPGKGTALFVRLPVAGVLAAR